MFRLIRDAFRAVWRAFAVARQLAAENLALRHQLDVVLRPARPRRRLKFTDRILWVWISRIWSGWRESIRIVRPETVIGWVSTLASIDFFTVPTIRFGVLYIFLVLAHDRRRILHFNVTSHPTAEWTSRQITEAFPEDSVPRYMIRDRDGVYGDVFRGRAKSMGINEVLIAPRSPWQSPFVERAIGTLRRECLDHIIVVDERHLRRVLREYIDGYYHPTRTHLSLGKDAPIPRPVQPPSMGKVVSFPVLGGLHHRYERRAA